MDGCNFSSWGSMTDVHNVDSTYISISLSPQIRQSIWMVVEQTLDAGGWGLLPTNSSQSICMGRGGADCYPLSSKYLYGKRWRSRFWRRRWRSIAHPYLPLAPLVHPSSSPSSYCWCNSCPFPESTGVLLHVGGLGDAGGELAQPGRLLLPLLLLCVHAHDHLLLAAVIHHVGQVHQTFIVLCTWVKSIK